MRCRAWICLMLCAAFTVDAGSSGGRIGSRVKIHTGRFGEFDKEYENTNVAWEIFNDHCGLEQALVQVWVRRDSTFMWEAPNWYLDDCKIRVMGDKREWTPGPWKGWEYQIKILR